MKAANITWQLAYVTHTSSSPQLGLGWCQGVKGDIFPSLLSLVGTLP